MNVAGHAVGKSSLGLVRLTATARGIRSMEFGGSRVRPGAPNAALKRLLARAIGLIERPARRARLPIDPRGTAFQLRVWNALRRIPAGSTATYADVARRIGRPASVRAVAAACAANRIAVVIPCHRVIRLDGTLSGYRWGVDRKRALLDREAAASRR